MAEDTVVPMPDPPKQRTVRKKTVTTDSTDNRANSGKGDTLPPPPRAEPPKSRPRSNSLEARLNDFLSVAAIPFATMGDTYSATIIAQRTPALASSLSDLANENPGIKKALGKMLEGGAWGGVALAAAAIVIPIAQNYGAVPGDDPFGFMYPETPARLSRGIPSPPAGFTGWSGQTPPPPEQSSAMGAPAPMPPPMRGGNPPAAVSVIPGNEDDTIPQYLPDAPPGVVTVAATGAGHNGAR